MTKRKEYFVSDISIQIFLKTLKVRPTKSGDFFVAVVAPEAQQLEEVLLLVIEYRVVQLGFADAPHQQHFRSVRFTPQRNCRCLKDKRILTHKY